MTTLRKITRAGAAFTMAAAFAACAGTGMATPEPGEALIRVDNQTERPYVSVSIEPVDGRYVALGTVPYQDSRTFSFRVPTGERQFRLIAVTQGDMDRDDHVVSQVLTLEGGEALTWYVGANRVEDAMN